MGNQLALDKHKATPVQRSMEQVTQDYTIATT